METVKIDGEFKALIPQMTPEEKALLEANIVAEGCLDALVLWKGLLLDGHNRFEICQRLSIPYKTNEISLAGRDDAKLWIIKNQLGRRNISNYDRAILALKMKDIIAAKAKENLSQGGKSYSPKEGLTTLSKVPPINTRTEIAKIAGVSEGSLAKVLIIQKKATPEQVGRLKSGEASLNQIHNEIKTLHVSQNKGENDDSGLDKTCSGNTIQIINTKHGDTAKQFDTIQWCLKAVSRKHLLKMMRHLYIDKDFMSGCDGYRLHIALNDWALEPGLYEILTIKANEILLAKSEDLSLEEYPSMWKAIPTQCKNGIPSFYCNMREFNNESYFVYHVYENTRHCYNIKHLEDICMEGILKIEMGEDYPKLVIASEDNDRLAILVPLRNQ